MTHQCCSSSTDEIEAGLDLSPELMLSAVLDALPVGLFWKDRESRIMGCNQKFADDSGAFSPTDLIGKANSDLYPQEQAAAYRADDLQVITTGESKIGIEEPFLLASGETTWVETNKVPLRNSAGNVIGVLGTYKDVTQRRLAGDERNRNALELAVAQKAAVLGLHDTLTGLANRRCLQEKLRERLSARVPLRNIAVIAVDLDRFKHINDVYGHAAGDEVLSKVGRLLSHEAAPEGFVARVGEDEFIVVFDYASDGELSRRLCDLIARFDEPIAIGEDEALIGITLGVATAPADGGDPDTLLRRADMALDRARKVGRTRFAFFQAEMELRATERAVLERDLKVAVRDDEIIPYFQPIVDLRSRDVESYEVLARWPHRQRGLVQPGQFIQIAIDAGLIGTLTTNVLRRACEQAMQWPDTPRITINIAAVLLRDVALSRKILRVLSECGFPPARLELEITEDALVADIDTARSTLRAFKNVGVTVALDDFGTGYSNLQHLRTLPFDVLKIDRAFIKSMHESADGLVIVKTILQLANNLGLKVVAEGVETVQQMDELIMLGCHYAQGFYFGVPTAGRDSSRDRGRVSKRSNVRSVA